MTLDSELFLISARLKHDVTEAERTRYPVKLFAFPDGVMELTKRVTFFVGDNGAGKSTVLEALAVASGFNAEGGSRNIRFTTWNTHSALWKRLTIAKGVSHPRDGFFLRAESFYNLATELVKPDERGNSLFDFYGDSYGGVSPHEQSHGESFLSVMVNRFGGGGLYLLDEPESALSLTGQLSLLNLIHEHVTRHGSQFIISTHSPILTAYPDAEIFQFKDGEIDRMMYKDTELYVLYKMFLNSDKMLLETLKLD